MQDQDAPGTPAHEEESRTINQQSQADVKPPLLLGDLLLEINKRREDPANARLQLYEVLLEEYDSLNQPPLLTADIIAIQQKINEYREVCKGIENEDEFERCAEKYNAELTSIVYRAMRAAQAHKARLEAEKTRREYAGKYKDIKDPHELKTVLDRAVVAEIYGTIQDLRWQYEHDYADTVDEVERKARVEDAVLKKIKDRALRNPTTKTQGAERSALPEGDKLANEEGADEDVLGAVVVDGGGSKRADDRIKPQMAEKVAARAWRSALCLSGGGIRSATFNLGILQGLARHGLLENFTYLSTVSGGGFIGSWLTAWIHRRGTREVVKDLRRPPRSPLEPDPKPISHLRTYSNYLSPKLGMLSADTWTLIATLSRNIAMTWLVFIPALMAFLMFPRLWAAFILRASLPVNDALNISLLVGSFASIIALSYIGVSLPSAGERNDSLKHFLGFCLFPLVIASISLATFWVRFKHNGGSLELKYFIYYQLAIIIIPWIVCFLTHLQRAKWHDAAGSISGRKALKYIVMVVVGTLMIGLAQAVSGYLMWFMATKVFTYNTESTRLYAAFAVPLMMLLLAWAGTLIAGFTSRFTEDADQEWWARAGAWLFIVMFGWTIVSLLVLYGPSLLTTVIDKLLYRRQDTWSSGDIIKVLTAAGAVISGIITLVGGFSSKTPANEREAQKSGLLGKLLPVVTSIAAVLFFAFIIVLIAFATNWLLTYGTNSLLSVGRVQSLNEKACSLLNYCSPVLDNKPLDHKYIILNSTFGMLSVTTLAIILIATVLGWLISSNKFSLHYMWRNRLIRAYLGASNEKRAPNLFTEFDEDDNVQMHELQTELFHDKSFNDPENHTGPSLALARLLAKIKDPAGSEHVEVSSYLNSRLSPSTKKLLDDYPLADPLAAPSKAQEPAFEKLGRAFINDLNDLLRSNTLYDEQRFKGVPLSPASAAILEQKLRDDPVPKRDEESEFQLNRRLLEDAYPGEIRRAGTPKPFHVVNIALNLTGSDKLAWQDRRAESFTVSPLHAGSFWPTLGYRRAKVYGRQFFNGIQGISLGTAAAISGAFVSPNMGYMMSSAVVRFIMTLFNVRFGWWLGNPGKAGARNSWSAVIFNRVLRIFKPGYDFGRTYDLNSPRLSVKPILYEAFGQINDKSPYVYLSDGGHFENLGLYEMVLRRCRFIVVSDASTDAEYSFQSLAMSIRQIRVDLGVPIDIKELAITGPSQNLKGKYCAVGTIRYSCVDRDRDDKRAKDEDFDGVLIYIKPSLIGNEPRDVVNYGQGSPDFPQEIIIDQWFSEAQFESYRILGSHIIDAICSGNDRNQLKDRNQVNFAAFARKARDHNQLDFMAFQEQINYAILEEQFKKHMQGGPPTTYLQSYERKVKDFIKDLLN